MDLNGAVYTAIAGRGAKLGREPAPPTDPARLVREAERVFGTHVPGVADRTWRRARHQAGWKPTPRVRGALRDALAGARRRSRLPGGRESWLRHPAAVGWAGTLRVSSDTRYRRILISTWPSWSPAFPGEMVDHFLARRDDQLGDPSELTFTTEIPEAEILDTEEVRFFQTRTEADGWRSA